MSFFGNAPYATPFFWRKTLVLELLGVVLLLLQLIYKIPLYGNVKNERNQYEFKQIFLVYVFY